MEKKSTLERKIARYTAFAGATLAAGSANAQLQYYDFVPDIVLNNATTALDLTGDSQADFALADTNITYSGYLLGLVQIIPLGGHGVAGDNNAGYYYPFQFNMNDPINSSLSWITSSNAGSLVFTVNGAAYAYGSHWQTGVTDKYIGIRVDITGGNYLYGWLRCDLSSDFNTLTVKDMGFNMMPNTAINAGQYNVSVDETLKGKVSMVNANNVLNISMTEVLTNGNLTVTSMGGQVVSNQAINGNSSVDLNSLASGIYVVNLSFDQGVYTQKIMIQK